jgi:hypothetical protein
MNRLAVQNNKGDAIWLVKISHETDNYQFQKGFD